MAAQRQTSRLLALALCVAAAWALIAVTPPAFVSPPRAVSSSKQAFAVDSVAQAAVLGAMLTVPEAAHAANQGYAVLQLGWAVFIIGLGPAVLFWIYFNKPEIL
uniref:Uncharacterized protein n=1 Tax=Mucochytrium quahogii TaxID=96639 RepID=A0A7S2WMF9_9STRA